MKKFKPNIQVYIPNTLTWLRIVAIPFLILSFLYESKFIFNDALLESYEGPYIISFAIFTSACITDFLDGYLARELRAMSEFGKFLDPIADKLLVSSTLLMLVWCDKINGIHILPTVIILCREVFIATLRGGLSGSDAGKSRLSVSKYAKWKTAFQMTSLSLLILSGNGSVLEFLQILGHLFLWCSAILSLLTGYDYWTKSQSSSKSHF